MAGQDLYEILGVSRSATEAEIKSAYRNLAKKYHPDKYAGAPESEKKEAEEKFKKINHAYDILSNPEKKSNYDQYGSEDGPTMTGGFSGFGGGGFGGMDDILNSFFGGMFGGSQRQSKANMAVDGDDITLSVTIDFKEAAFGCERNVKFNRTERCSACKGTGAKDGTAYKTCSRCGGTGYVRYTQKTPFGQTVRTVPCDVCKGKGKEITSTCSSCGGKGYNKLQRELHIDIPAGVDNGQMMSYRNEGEAGLNGGSNGNLIIVINVKPHPYFRRQKYDLYLDVPVTFMQAACGATIEVPTLDGKISFDVPQGTQYGAVFKVKNKGLKYLNRETKGDLYITIKIETPKDLSKKQKNLLSDFETSLSNDQYPANKKFQNTKM